MKKIILVAALLSAASLPARAAPEDDIRALMERNRASDAYQLGRQHPDRLGDPAFDFYFGIAALDAGAPGEGVLALERYVMTFPDNRNARFHLARGFYILGEDQRARDEFESLRNGAGGEELIAIERYLDAIRARESRYLPTANAWVEVGLGYDNNLNAGVWNNHRVHIPGVLRYTPVSNSVSVREADWSTILATGLQGTLPVAPGIALYGMATLDTRHYRGTDNDQFNQLNYGASGGVSFLSGKNLFRVGAALQQQRVYEQDYLFTAGLTADWTHQFNQFDRVNLGLVLGRHDYRNSEVWAFKDKDATYGLAHRTRSGADVKDAGYGGVSLGWTHVFGVAWQPVLAISAGLHRERNNEGRNDLSRDLFTSRLQLSATPAARWGLSLGLGYLRADYEGPYAQVASESQIDNNYSIDGTVSYRISRQWSARGEFVAVTQDSNIGLFDYNRTAGSMKLRYEFN